jgi:CheY-like chemotaxis protein
VVVFSSSARGADREAALDLGANDYVEKPNSGVEFSAVVARIKEWLESSEDESN